MLAALPQLEVLDLHTVTPLERLRAQQAAGGGKDAAARATVAFGCKVPSFDASLTARVPERSTIEKELQKVGEASAAVLLSCCGRAECLPSAGLGVWPCMGCVSMCMMMRGAGREGGGKPELIE